MVLRRRSNPVQSQHRHLWCCSELQTRNAWPEVTQVGPCQQIPENLDWQNSTLVQVPQYQDLAESVTSAITRRRTTAQLGFISLDPTALSATRPKSSKLPAEACCFVKLRLGWRSKYMDAGLGYRHRIDKRLINRRGAIPVLKFSRYKLPRCPLQTTSIGFCYQHRSCTSNPPTFRIQTFWKLDTFEQTTDSN
ncbi:hypothetical protein BT67DRAFT_212956 [Trichocladium antarcticum]|uniref:Uncharacterized protein n=1 Tax=Trichocladium antarcticum TaxID=1450529 RepID=A0AAN6ZAB9_9PEZI|nr:hypothetical protein BT67DRAFT_212956 [Trichocladium antarcticum]